MYMTDGANLPVLVQTFGSSIRDMGSFDDFVLLTHRPNYTVKTTDVLKYSGSTGEVTLLTSDAFGARILPHDLNPVLSTGIVLFAAGNGLWRTDGTAAGYSLSIRVDYSSAIQICLIMKRFMLVPGDSVLQPKELLTQQIHYCLALMILSLSILSEVPPV